MTNFNFTNRDEYLVWVATWKAEYADLSVRIREAKKTISTLQKSGSSAASEMRGRQYMRKQATHYLETRALAKVEAQAQYTAQKELAA